MIVTILFVVIFASMIVEASVSNRHDRALRAAGAIEPRGDVYKAMQSAYPAAFLVMLAEGAVRGSSTDGVFWIGAAIYVAAKALKYWAISTLGTRWTFRVLVPPDSTRIVSGPYRLMRHPNYAAVTGELAGTALMAHALIAGPLATIGFTALMVARIRVEERALCRSRSIERR